MVHWCLWSLLLSVIELSRIGREDAELPQHVTADGPGIESHYGVIITNSAGVISLHPNGNICSLDGVPVTKPTKLTHGNTQYF